MRKLYTIIIPIFNEESKISQLLEGLREYHNKGHEILIIDDGSTDRSNQLLSKSNWVNLIRHKKNKGKGVAIKKALKLSKNEKTIIYDGDLELDPYQIKKLMILNNNNCVLATRYKKINPLESVWDFGNFLLNNLFNLFNNSNLQDALCCAKAFHKSDININNLKSDKFDIDVEISSQLVNRVNDIDFILLNYKRRTGKDGKKLTLMDSISIIKRILNTNKKNQI